MNKEDAKKDKWYRLQREATKHKKAGDMTKAINCLKKSNDIADSMSRPYASEKDYIRLVKYLRLDGRDADAEIAEKDIYIKHPEFRDKRISNRKNIATEIDALKRLNNDLLRVHSSDDCPICKQYNHKIYSISGTSRKYPKVPDEVLQGICEKHSCVVGIFTEGISKP